MRGALSRAQSYTPSLSLVLSLVLSLTRSLTLRLSASGEGLNSADAASAADGHVHRAVASDAWMLHLTLCENSEKFRRLSVVVQWLMWARVRA